ncbi:MAG TPA: hypothetical protein DEQ64_09085 [Lachnoclostridium sp.]|uniref:hypothetical protein n=1 Tax=Lacrimispora sp. TaxID=2719234 RepID=UPI000ECC79AA|nr:hypothetical protein [Lacrimispora sp.]HCD43870.1 hypothetical protein [Lachnoclostridium sp.]
MEYQKYALLQWQAYICNISGEITELTEGYFNTAYGFSFDSGCECILKKLPKIFPSSKQWE